MSRTLVIGLGSPHGDDRIGWLLADAFGAALSQRPGVGVVTRRAASPADLLDWTDIAEHWMIFDGCLADSDGSPIAPGELLRWRWPDCPCDRFRRSGTHDLSLGDALTLMSRLDTLPRRVDLIGVVVGRERGGVLGETIDPALAAAVPTAVERLLGDWDA